MGPACGAGIGTCRGGPASQDAGSDTLSRMAIRTELNLRVPNSPGTLAAICRLLADEHVNITALALDTSGQLRLVVDNSVRAAGILRERHYQVEERNVVLVPVANGTGSLAPVLNLAAESGVNIEYVYATVPDGSATAAVVMGVDDAARAATATGW
jgi:hypothetical protein